MVDKEVANQMGWLESIKERLNLDAIMEQLRLSKDRLIEVALYSGIGFLSGFLLKKYSWYVFVLVLVIVSLVALHQFELIKIVVNWDNVYEFFGIQPAAVTGDNVLAVAWEWMRANMLISISFIVGFLIGLKLG